MNESIKRILWTITELEACTIHLQATLDTERIKLRELLTEKIKDTKE